MKKQRDIFAELVQGFDDLKAEREGKITLKDEMVEYNPVQKLGAREVVAIRNKLNLSQNSLARRLRVEFKTLANWEQGRAQPNAQATILLKLVDRHPEMLKEIAEL